MYSQRGTTAAGLLIRGRTRQAVRKYTARAAAGATAFGIASGGVSVMKRRGSTVSRAGKKARITKKSFTRRRFIRKRITKRRSYRKGTRGGPKLTRVNVPGEYSREFVKRGRKLSSAAMALKVVQAGMQRIVFSFKRFRDTVGWSGDFGAYPNSYDVNAGIYATPVYLYNLTAIMNGSAAPTPFWRLQHDSSNNFYFTAQNGQSIIGVDNAGLQAKSFGGNAIPRVNRAVFDWARMRFNLYGAKNRPLEVRVRLIKFDDDGMLPENRGPSVAGVNSVDLNNYWLNYLKPLISNPIATAGQVPARGMAKILSTRVYTFQPTVNVVNDPDSAIRTVDWFMRLGKIVDFTGQGSTSFTVTKEWQNATRQENSFGVLSNQSVPPKPRDNMYVLIDAQYKVAAGVPPTASDTCASFDMNIETGWRFVEGN